jgi:NTE family protein
MSVQVATTTARGERLRSNFGQIVVVFQGGGALGAYQAGVYQALNEAGIEPDWLIGTSIGAINAAIIAGNKPQDRLERLKEFWRRVEHAPGLEALSRLPWVGASLPNWATLAAGVAAFFKPNPLAFMGWQIPLAPDAAGYYSTMPLQVTLNELVDFSLIASCKPRLTVGAAKVTTSEMRYFDSRDMTLAASHIMASGALPPAFPAVQIDGELYWDGGILSNTPVEAIFDDNPRRNALIFAVHVWNPEGSEPSSIWAVMNRQKELQYSSRAMTHIARQKEIHRLRHIVAELSRRLPESELSTPHVSEMASYGCLTRMHVVRLLAPRLAHEDHTKDIDFSREGIGQRWRAGFDDACRALEAAAWEREVDPVEGFYLHESPRESRLEVGRVRDCDASIGGGRVSDVSRSEPD